MKAADLQVSRFKGLNTVDDPLALGLAWQTRAENIQITSAGKPARRDGFAVTPIAAGTRITAAYATRDTQRAYLIDAGTLKDLQGNVLATGLSSRRTSWAEVNDLVFLANGADHLMVRQDGVVLPWAWPVPSAPTLAAVTGSRPAGLYRACCTFILPDGRETGPSDVVEIELQEGEAMQVSGLPSAPGLRTRTYISAANSTVLGHAESGTEAFVWNYPPTSLGIELATTGLDPIPETCDVVQVWQGRVWAALYDPATDVSAIFPSKALGFHLFDLDEGVAVPDHVLMMAPTPGALIIGTDRHVWALSAEGQLQKLADYGVVPGTSWAFDLTEDGRETDNTVLFWTQRGLCRGLPFANLTAGHLSVPPGVQAGVAVVATGGEKHLIATLHQGGTAFNPRS